VYTYLPDAGWGGLNLLASIGGLTIALSVLVFLVAVVRSRSGAPAPANPWDADTLEWATSSPPPPYNFALQPVVTSRAGLWACPLNDAPVVTGLRTDMREVLVTTLLDAEPDHRHRDPEPSIWPLLAALATGLFFITLIFTPWAVTWGGVALLVTLVGWGWPKEREHRLQVREETGT
jgi:hypothetical protein